jgi:hypothetical protein
MTLTLTTGSASELFAQACQAVLAAGRPAAPRGLATTEVLGAVLTLTDPRRRLVDLPPARVINPAFAVAEAMWILSGSDDPWIYLFNEKLADYADGGHLMGAYGPRLRRWHGTTDQLAQVRQALTADPGTRRAVIQLYDPEADALGHKDVPCTLGYRNSRELHQTGEEAAGQQLTRLPGRRSGRPDASILTWEDLAVIPSDARFAHQGACIRREGQKRSDEGTRGFVAEVRVPGAVSGGFQYRTPPEKSSLGLLARCALDPDAPATPEGSR